MMNFPIVPVSQHTVPLSMFRTGQTLKKLRINHDTQATQSIAARTETSLREMFRQLLKTHQDEFKTLDISAHHTQSGIVKVCTKITNQDNEDMIISAAQDGHSACIWFIETMQGRNIYFHRKEVDIILSAWLYKYA